MAQLIYQDVCSSVSGIREGKIYDSELGKIPEGWKRII
jgi:hypothetical protein